MPGVFSSHPMPWERASTEQHRNRLVAITLRLQLPVLVLPVHGGAT